MICDDYAHNVCYAGRAGRPASTSIWLTNIWAQHSLNAIGLTGYTELAYVVNLMFTNNQHDHNGNLLRQVIWALTGGLARINSARLHSLCTSAN